MTKSNKKSVIVIVMVLLLIVGIGFGFVSLTNQKNYWKEQAGEYNLTHWNQIHTVADKIDKAGYTVESLKTYYPYVNALGGYILSPSFKGQKSVSAFWSGYYDPFVQMLSSQSFSKEQQAKGISLFETMNKELLSMCSSILENVSFDPQKKMDLMDSQSDFYVKSQETINSFCDKYTAQIAPFIQKS